MTDSIKPLLFFRKPSSSSPKKRHSRPPPINCPKLERQKQRIDPKFEALHESFKEAKLSLQSTTPNTDPELILVFEITKQIDRFKKAAQHIGVLECLLESFEENAIEVDEDFYCDDKNKKISLTTYLLSANHKALKNIEKLWQKYKKNKPLGKRFAPWKELFKYVSDIRHWNEQDRAEEDIKKYWKEELENKSDAIFFEIEAWCFQSDQKNNDTKKELVKLIAQHEGKIIQDTLIKEIAYYGFLVEIPASRVIELLDGDSVLLKAEQIMYFRPRGQCAVPADDGTSFAGINILKPSSDGHPIIALLDGLPQQNHPLLSDRLQMSKDTHDWEEEYPAKERQHGTAMASLILHGDLTNPEVPLKHRLYVQPVMRPNPQSFKQPKPEEIPQDRLLLDLMHQSVNCLFEGERPEAPTVKVINLSLGDARRLFCGKLSPWARLLDWLSSKYNVLFIVSAGNISEPTLGLDPNEDAFKQLSSEERCNYAIRDQVSQKINKRLISPAESINAITVGATHDDASIYSQTENMYDVFPKGGISPFSRIGPGFRNAIKPDILMQGGRMLYTENLRDKRILKGVDYRREPGHLVAAPLGNNLRGNEQRYTRGTSNAAALTTRFAGQIYEVIESIRTQDIDAVSEDFEAVLLKALLVHSVNPSYLKDLIVSALDNQDDKGVDKKLSPFIGYGVADPERVMGCTAKRVTLLGYGSLNHDEACDFKMPIPVSLNAKKIERKLTVTLAWISPINASSAKYRIAKLWFDKPKGDFDEKDTIGKQEHENQHVIKKGTVQRAVFKTDKAEPFGSDASINIKVNCTASHQEKLKKPIRFGLCVTLEVKEKINVQAELFEKEINIYEEIKAKIKTPIPIS